MSFDTLIVPLLSAPIFAGLEPPQLKSIAMIAERVAFDDGVDLIRDGEAGEAAYVIASGRVVFCTPDDDEPLEIELGAGSVVGELAMFVDMDHETTVTAKGEVIALRIPRAALQETLEKDPTLSEHFVDIMRARLEMMARRLRAADRMLGFLDREADRPSTGVH